MKIYICNALAMGMLDRAVQARNTRERATGGSPRTPRPVTLEEARAILRPQLDGRDLPVEIIPAGGHADTARLIGDALGIPMPVARITVRLQGGPDELYERAEIALIGAYTGPRLPEGCTQLPEGASLEWWIV